MHSFFEPSDKRQSNDAKRQVHWGLAEQTEILRWALAQCNEVKLTLSGPSMAPSICSGDGVIFKGVTLTTRLKVGQIYLFEAPGSQVYAHRLIRIDRQSGETYFIFKGDGLMLADPAVTQNAVLGEVLHVEHRTAPAATAWWFFSRYGQASAWFYRLRPWLALMGRKLFA